MGLFQRIRNALVGGKSDPEADLSALLEGYELPSFPAVVMNVLASLRDPNASPAVLAGQLETDPGLHVKVLRLVNSASFALAREVTNLHRAVTLLGRGRLETIVLTHAVTDALPKNPAPGFDLQAFWLTSARRAFLARAIANQLGSRHELEAFTVGLLQDMAVPVLADRKGAPYVELLARWREDDETRLDALEREAFDLDHPTLGALMARKWDLPDYLSRAIALHHDPGDEELEPAILFVAKIKEALGHVEEAEAGDGDDEAAEAQQEALVSRACDELGLEGPRTAAIVRQAFAQAEAFASQLG